MSYVAPIKDMLFDIRHLANIDQVAQMPGFEDAGFDTAQAVLEEAAKFNQDVLSPLNWEGDKNPSSWKDGVVSTTPGFKQNWCSVSCWESGLPSASRILWGAVHVFSCAAMTAFGIPGVSSVTISMCSACIPAAFVATSSPALTPTA